eukprot:355237-Chlamydomonas_euryale.AAC.2
MLASDGGVPAACTAPTGAPALQLVLGTALICAATGAACAHAFAIGSCRRAACLDARCRRRLLRIEPLPFGDDAPRGRELRLLCLGVVAQVNCLGGRLGGITAP